MKKPTKLDFVTKSNLRLIESAIEQLESDALGLERTHPDRTCHGYAARIRDCTDVLREAHTGLVKSVPGRAPSAIDDDEDSLPMEP